MSLLVDTNAFLWWLAGGDRLGRRARAAIDGGRVAVSAVTVWEIAIKRALGKLTVPEDPAVAIEAEGFDRLPITFEHAEATLALPLHHRDPFDRMLIAQAQVEGLTIVTADPVFARYAVPVLSAA